MNTSHQNGGAPDVFLKNARALQRKYHDADERVCESVRRSIRRRPLHCWFEMKDAYAWGVVHKRQQILQRLENDEPLGSLPEELAHQQSCLATITVKCSYLFDQWNRCSGGLK